MTEALKAMTVALKARPIPAWGASPWDMTVTLKARPIPAWGASPMGHQEMYPRAEGPIYLTYAN
jgi:hypothetical protein